MIVLGATVGAVVLFSIVLASQATTPINELSRGMREISSDRLALAAGTFDGHGQGLQLRRRRDEIGRLATSFNDLLARLADAFARERQFISDASHELKTPLTSINANAQMLLRWGDQDHTIRRESLETIARESADLAGMVNGMLTLAKADRGDEIPKEPLSLAQIASEVTQNASSRAAEKSIDLKFSYNAKPIVYGDAHLLRQMIGNLVDNAIKFCDHAAVDVRVGEKGTSAWVEVADSGPGIPEAERRHIFERFYRADKARSREVPGTGLGLAIVRSIARVHGGDALAERAPGGGALFRIVLPRMNLPFTESLMMPAMGRRYNGCVHGRIGAGSTRDAPRLAVLVGFADARARRRGVRRRSVADPQRARQPGPGHDPNLGSSAGLHLRRNGQPTCAISARPTSIPSIPKQIQFASDPIQTDHGLVSLPAESFVIPELPGREHDEILARGSGRMTIMIPRGTAMVMAQQRAGHLTIENYHGVFIAHARAAGDFAR